MLSPMRFGSDLKHGDRVVYHYKDIGNKENVHSLEVFSKDDKNMIILEQFEGNSVYIRLDNKTKEVFAIWGTDEFGESQTIDVLSKNELSVFENEVDMMFNEGDSILKVSDSFYLEARTKKKQIGVNSRINTFDVKMDIEKTKIPAELSQQFEHDNKLSLSNEVPKMFPLLPVAVTNFNKRSILKQCSYGFVENSVLELRSFRK